MTAEAAGVERRPSLAMSTRFTPLATAILVITCGWVVVWVFFFKKNRTGRGWVGRRLVG